MSRGCSLVAWFRFVFNECRFLLIQRNRRNYFATHKKSTSDDKQTFNTRRWLWSHSIPYTCLGRSHSKCSKHEHWSLFNVCMATRSFSLHRFLFLFTFFFRLLCTFVAFYWKIPRWGLGYRFSKTSNHFVAKFHSVNSFPEQRSQWIDANAF